MIDSEVAAAEADKPGSISYWMDQIDRYDKQTQEWRERSEKINKIYLDQHRTQASPRRFALLWSNIETLKPAVYARLPVAVVSRRYKDQDKVGRKASEILERCINTTFDLGGVNEVMECVRDDRLIASRGTAWVRYEAEFDPVDKNKKTSERAVIEYVHWSDFGHSMNRTWPEVNSIWRRVYMTKAKVTKRWGKDKAEKLTYEVRPEYANRGGVQNQDAMEPQAIVYEIWDKDKKRVCWCAKENKTVLEEGDPPLSFRDFWPCPKPIYGSKGTGSLIPTPDYRYYQDQAEEIDDLTQKIADLTSWLRLKGFYAGGPSSEGADAVEELLKASGNQVLVKIESWAGFADKGGVKGLIEWLPLDVMAQALTQAIQARTQLINDVYQISGISDILRGDTDPNETLGAQELKAQTGSRRQAPTQRDVARFARDLAEMAGEVIAEHFSPETITAMSGSDLTQEPPPELTAQMSQLQFQVQQLSQMPAGPVAPPAPSGAPAPGGPAQGGNPALERAQQALQQLQQQMQQYEMNKAVLQLMRDEKTRSFRIEIETDSTIEPDEQKEKQARSEFVATVGDFMQKALPAVQMMPQLAPMLGEMLLFLVRGYRVGRSMEDLVEKSMGEIAQAAMGPKPPSPEEQKLDLEKQKIGMQAQADREKQQNDLSAQQAELQMKERESAQKLEFERVKHEQECQFKDREHQADMQMRQCEMQMKQADGEQARAMQADQHAQSLSMEQEKSQASISAQQQEAEAGRDLERDKLSLPKREDFLGAMEKQGQVVKDVLEGVMAEAQQIKKVLDQVSQEMASPVELIRDGGGQLAGMRRGNRTMQVKRGADGRVAGLQ